MKRILCVVLAIIIVLSIPVVAFAANDVPHDVLEASETVVRIVGKSRDYYSFGSGFVIVSDTTQTLIATNNHVIDDISLEIDVWVSNKEHVGARVIAKSAEKDLAILKLEYPVTSLKSVDMNLDGAKQGSAVYAVGFPSAADELSDTLAFGSEEVTITDGIVSAIREVTLSSKGTPVSVLQISAPINPGNSGGPLFDAKGQLIGINTFGVAESQGVYGAISISELVSFLQQNGFSIRKGLTTSEILIIVSVALFLVGVISVLIWRRKQRKKRSEKVVVSLRDFIKLNGPVSFETAVHLMMPIAVSLRSLHTDGKSHLAVAPECLFVSSTGTAAISPAPAGNTFFSGYSAPEQYRGRNAGGRTDIYGFCAVLSFLVTGIDPQNALDREDGNNGEGEIGISDTDAIIAKGMQLNISDRYESIQDLIFTLAPYNIEPSENLNLQPVSPQGDKKKSKKRMEIPAKKIVVTATAIVCVVSLGIIGYLNYRGYTKAVGLAENGNFLGAENAQFLPAITKTYDSLFEDYIHAGVLYQTENFAGAEECFTALANYRDSQFQLGLSLFGQEKYEQAEMVFSELAESGYVGASEKRDEAAFQTGLSLFEQGKYKQAEIVFSDLADSGYEGASDKRNEAMLQRALRIRQSDPMEALSLISKLKSDGFVMTGTDTKLIRTSVYDYAKSQYAVKKYRLALDTFKELRNLFSNFDDLNTYILLCEIHLREKSSNTYTVWSLSNHTDVADVKKILVSDWSYASPFLDGTWKNPSGQKIVVSDADNTVGFYGFKGTTKSSFWLEDGKIYTGENRSTAKQIFTIYVINKNTIKIVVSNNESYSLYRN